MQYSTAQWLLLFFTYCFLGWVWESSYVSIRRKEWVNRGFLHGPVVPIYGFGAIVILVLTFSFRESLIHIYLLGSIGATVVEFVTGIAMEKLFGMRYWDYSHRKFNLYGHISLFVSLVWGVFALFLVKLLHPPIAKEILKLPSNIVEPLSLAFVIIFVVDATISVQSALGMKKLLRRITENNKLITTLESKLNGITMDINQTSAEFQRRLQRFRADVNENLQSYKHKLETLRQSNRYLILEKLENRRNIRSNFLKQLNERTDKAINEIQLRINSTSSEEKVYGSRVLTRMKELKSTLRNIEINMESIKDEEYRSAANVTRRYPSSVSKHFKDALDAIKALNRSRKEK